MGVDVLDYETLISPYSEPSEGATRAPQRTAAGQRLWLSQRGFPESIINEAMRMIYSEITFGRVFTKQEGDDRPSGYWLDRCLLDTCRKLMLESHAGGLAATVTDVRTIANFSRSALGVAMRKGIAIGVVVTSVIFMIIGYFLWP